MRKYPLILTAMLSLNLAACQPAMLQPNTLRTGTTATSSRVGAPITIRIQPVATSGMQVKALAKTLADVATYTVTLYDNANVMVPSGGGFTNPMTITAPATTVTLTGMPEGTGYYVKVQAFDAGPTSISQGGAVQSSNTVDLASGVATYSSGTALTVALTLTAGTVGTGAATGTITDNSMLTSTGYGLGLVNNASGQIATKATASQPTTGLSFTAVQEGAHTGATHELWMFAANANQATPARPFAGASNGAGTVNAAFAGTTLAATAVTSYPTTAVANSNGNYADTSGNVYFFNGTDIIKADAGASYAQTAIVSAPGTVTSMCVDASGNVYYTTGNDIMKADATASYATSNAVTASNVGQIAVDEAGNLYYADTTNAGDHMVLKAIRSGSTWGTAATVVSSTGGAVTALATDAFQDVFFTLTGVSSVKRSQRNVDQVTYAAVSAPVTTAAEPTSLAVDRSGNVYFTDGQSTSSVFLWHAGDGTTNFRVAGTGAAGTGMDTIGAGLATAQALVSPSNVAVNAAGMLFFTTKGTNGTDDILRKV
ncbi:MAG: hypothetical protein H7338_08425 [Candidatus Sericytochromatia bacterium]|nr:hypothetical protein [Candidatus Sericytochromatia bacterium]